MTLTVVAPPASTALAFFGPGELDHLDPRSPYTIRSGQLLGLLGRRLFDYRASDDRTPVPDLALAIPTVANGGVSADGRSYRFNLRRGVYWDAQGARELVAGDFVRGFKRIAHPNAAAVRRYFTDTIVGMREYCQAYDAELGGWQANAPDFAQFQAQHQVAGIRAVDPHTLQIDLIAPANDLLHLLATGVAAAAPREYDYYVPDSHELLRNAPSAGPYRIARARSRGSELVLEPNPRWDPDTDPVHQRPVNEIRIGGPVGDADQPGVAWSFGTVTWTSSAEVPAPGWRFGHYLVANLRAGAAGRLAVRQAVAFAVDKAAVRDLVAGVGCATRAAVQHGLLLTDVPQADSGSVGRAAELTRARELLADVPIDSLTLAIADTELARQVAAVLSTNLAECGLTVQVRRLPAHRYFDALRSAGWDFALAGWTPDWYGNNGRTALEPLLRGGAEPGAGNHGGYDNPAVDRLLSEALEEADPEQARELWQQLERAVLADLPIVPMVAHACGPCAAAADAAPQLRWFAPAG